MGDKLEVVRKTTIPINIILLDHARSTMWGGSSDHGEDYRIGWRDIAAAVLFRAG